MTASKGMEDWEKHIRTGPTSALCGADITPMDWALVDGDHARACVEKEARIQPCPKCWAALSVQ